MSYNKMSESLEKIFKNNVQKIRRKNIFNDSVEKLSVPALSGPTGIGKTASVKEFAKNKGFKLVRIDCSYHPVNFLVIHLNNAIVKITDNKDEGCVFLIENINEADDQFLTIINQYRNNYLDYFMEVAVPDVNGKIIQKKIEISHHELPENIFIVGEKME